MVESGDQAKVKVSRQGEKIVFVFEGDELPVGRDFRVRPRADRLRALAVVLGDDDVRVEDVGAVGEGRLRGRRKGEEGGDGEEGSDQLRVRQGWHRATVSAAQAAERNSHPFVQLFLMAP
jgi:hypothetical protein